MNYSVTSSACYQPADNGISRDRGKHKRQGQTPPETELKYTGIHRARDDKHDCIVHHFHDRD